MLQGEGGAASTGCGEAKKFFGPFSLPCFQYAPTIDVAGADWLTQEQFWVEGRWMCRREELGRLGGPGGMLAQGGDGVGMRPLSVLVSVPAK